MTLVRCVTVLALVVPALLGLTGASEAATAASRRVDRCYAVRVESIAAPNSASTKRRRFRRRFSAREVLDLRFNVLLHAKNDAGLVEIKLYTPAGRLYDILEARADGDQSALPRRSRRRRRVVSAKFPVAGTHITNRSLYGKWRADVYLNGSDERCGRPKRFFIQP